MAIISLKKRTLEPTSTPQGESTLQAYDQSGSKVFVERGKYYPGISLTAPNNNISGNVTTPTNGQTGALPTGSVASTSTNPQADTFNKMLTDIFAQSKGVTSIDLLKKRRDLEKASADAVSNPAVVPEGTILSPSQQQSLISTKQASINNQISENDYEIARAQKAVSNFEDIVNKTQAWGQEYADKMVVPDTVIQSYKKIIEADPDKLATILSTLNDKSKSAVMAALDYTKMGPKVDPTDNAPKIQTITDADGNSHSVYWDGTKMVDASNLLSPSSGDTPENNKISMDFNNWKDTFGGTITQSFDTPVNYFADGRTTHGGYDIAGKLGEAITAPVSGTVISVTKESDGSGWGNSILLQDEQGNKWRMGHFQDLTVVVGEKVNAGSQVVGYLGNTGTVMKGDGTKPSAEELAAGRGTHLHIEAKDTSGNFIDIGKTKESKKEGLTSDGYDISKFTPKFYNSSLGQKVLNNEQQYYTNFLSQPAVKTFIENQTKFGSIKAIIDSGVGGTEDLALVFEFMKSLDPTSVVRESEYNTAAKSGNPFKQVAARIGGYVSKGQILPEEVKQSFAKISQIKLDEQKKIYEQVRSQARKTAATQGLNPENVAPDLVIGGYNNSNTNKTIIYQGKKYNVDANGDMTLAQ